MGVKKAGLDRQAEKKTNWVKKISDGCNLINHKAYINTVGRNAM